MVDYPIDINCDMGESYGSSIVGQDENLMPLITSCNIACGFHGGDPFQMEKTILIALKHNVRIGAHPSYPDLEGFGRKNMNFDAKELNAIICYQISALKGMVERLGGKLSYVKPHGALYNKASKNIEEASTIIEAIQSIDTNLSLMGLAGSIMQTVARTKGINFIAEAFCDRKYEKDGTLVSREKDGSVFGNVQEVIDQIKVIVFENKIMIDLTYTISVYANSICVHGDNPKALEILKAMKHMFENYRNEN